MQRLLISTLIALCASQLVESARFKFCLFNGKTASEKLNANLVDTVGSIDLSRNIEAAKRLLETEKDLKTKKLLNEFVELANIDDICSDQSLKALDALTFSMRKDSYDAFEQPKLRRRLNSIVARVAEDQLKTCGRNFIKEYVKEVDEVQLSKRFESLKYLPEGLRKGSKEGSRIKSQNAWLLKQRGVDLHSEGATSQAAVGAALRNVLRDEGIYTLKRVDQKTGKMVNDMDYIAKLLKDKLIAPCGEFAAAPEARILKKLLTVLRVGNIDNHKMEEFYDDYIIQLLYLDASHHPIEWTMRLDACERLLQSNLKRLGTVVSGLVLFKS